ncbi:hypothetical protein M8494_25245 [Serratia ureilytica]
MRSDHGWTPAQVGQTGMAGGMVTLVPGAGGGCSLVMARGVEGVRGWPAVCCAPAVLAGDGQLGPAIRRRIAAVIREALASR